MISCLVDGTGLWGSQQNVYGWKRNALIVLYTSVAFKNLWETLRSFWYLCETLGTFGNLLEALNSSLGQHMLTACDRAYWEKENRRGALGKRFQSSAIFGYLRILSYPSVTFVSPYLLQIYFIDKKSKVLLHRQESIVTTD